MYYYSIEDVLPVVHNLKIPSSCICIYFALDLCSELKRLSIQNRKQKTKRKSRRRSLITKLPLQVRLLGVVIYKQNTWLMNRGWVCGIKIKTHRLSNFAYRDLARNHNKYICKIILEVIQARFTVTRMVSLKNYIIIQFDCE